MPYIPKSRRDTVITTSAPVTSIVLLDVRIPGDLNYVFTEVICTYIRQCGGVSYPVINDVLGALEGCKLEFYRRIATPYEDQKKEQNGDVYYD